MTHIPTQTIPPTVREQMNAEMAQLYYEEVKQCKNGLIAAINRVIDRGYTLLGISLTIASASVAWMSQGGGAAAVLALVVCMVVMSILLLNITTTHGFHREGSSVGELKVETYVPYYRKKCQFSTSRTYVNLLCDQIDNMNADLCTNTAVHTKIVKWYARCIHIYLVGIIQVIAVWVLL